MKHDVTTRARQAFTLIEMLTVIAIIAILAAILVPAITSSIERGRRSYCQNNLSQIGKALNMWADANRERLPAVSINVQSYWDLQILPYMNNTTNVFLCPSDPYIRGAAGDPRTYAVNGGTETTVRFPFGNYSGAPSGPLRFGDLDYNKGDLILVGERPGNDAGDRGLVGGEDFAAMNHTAASVHERGKGGNYLMSSMAVKYLRANEPAFSIALGAKGNLWVVYTGD